MLQLHLPWRARLGFITRNEANGQRRGARLQQIRELHPKVSSTNTYSHVLLLMFYKIRPPRETLRLLQIETPQLLFEKWRYRLHTMQKPLP